MVEVDPSPPRIEVGESSSLAMRKTSKKDQKRLPDFIGVGTRQFVSEPSLDRSLLIGRRTWTNVPKRASGLNEAKTVRKLACLIQLPRDRAFMDSLTLSDLLDHSITDSLRVRLCS